MMKMHGRWVAWMAALALAAMLAATPREGAAGPRPYLMPQDPPGPILGDPEEPSITTQGWELARIHIGRLFLWLQGLQSRTISTTATRQPIRQGNSSRVAEHE